MEVKTETDKYFSPFDPDDKGRCHFCKRLQSQHYAFPVSEKIPEEDVEDYVRDLCLCDKCKPLLTDLLDSALGRKL